jgi:CRP-like cAMP-binding protein
VKLEKVEFKFDLKDARKVQMTDLQNQYFGVFQQEKSIEKTVHFFLKSGWLVNFSQLWDLVQNLEKEKVLIPHLTEVFAIQPKQHAVEMNFKSFCHWPFFRSLPAVVQSHLWQSHKVVEMPAGALVISIGDQSRDLWIQISGQSAIFVKGHSGSKKMVGLIDQMATFGELGFFLNEARTAEVKTLTQSKFVKIPHSEKMAALVNPESFQEIRHRFQVLRAFIQSPLFKLLPESTMDEMIFRGTLVQSAPQQLLFKEGDLGTNCYILVQGQVGIFQNGELINRLRQGACLGEIALFWSQGRRTATAISQDDCILLEIRQKDFYSIMASNIELAARLEALAYERGSRDQQRKATA